MFEEGLLSLFLFALPGSGPGETLTQFHDSGGELEMDLHLQSHVPAFETTPTTALFSDKKSRTRTGIRTRSAAQLCLSCAVASPTMELTAKLLIWHASKAS